MILNMKETNKDVLSTNCELSFLFLATWNHDLCTLTIQSFAAFSSGGGAKSNVEDGLDDETEWLVYEEGKS